MRIIHSLQSAVWCIFFSVWRCTMVLEIAHPPLTGTCLYNWLYWLSHLTEYHLMIVFFSQIIDLLLHALVSPPAICQGLELAMTSSKGQKVRTEGHWDVQSFRCHPHPIIVCPDSHTLHWYIISCCLNHYFILLSETSYTRDTFFYFLSNVI